MLSTVNDSPMNRSGRETLLHGTGLFPCMAYTGNIHNYIGGQISAHWHPELEVFFLVEGKVRAFLGAKEYFLNPGDGYFVNENVLHGIFCETDQECNFQSIVIDPSVIYGSRGSAFDLLYIRPFLERGSRAFIFPAGEKETRKIRNDFRISYDACADNSYGYEFPVREHMSQLIMEIKDKDSASATKRAMKHELAMKQMIAYMDNHFQEEVRVNDIAKAAGICARECQRFFFDDLRQSPVSYLISRRIAQAAKLLISTNAPVGEIAQDCGFSIQSYFNRQFMKYTGTTPTKYRALQRHSNEMSNNTEQTQ